jgi:ABC-type multidrug transport system ATPase subunit
VLLLLEVLAVNCSNKLQALARALYIRPKLLVLDDPFSALDKTTATTISKNLFGLGGILRRQGAPTVFMTTSNGGLDTVAIFCGFSLTDMVAAQCAAADYVLVIEQGQIKAQGPTGAMSSAIEELSRASDASTIPEKGPTATSSISLSASQRIQTSDRTLEHADLSSEPKNRTKSYQRYIHAMGVDNFLALLLFTALYSLFSTLPQYWLKLWTDSQTMSSRQFSVVYALLSITAWSATNGSMW